MAKKRKKFKKKWTKEDHDFLLEYTGIYSNKSLARKFKVSVASVRSQQLLLGVSIEKNFKAHDLVTLAEFSNQLGLPLSRVQYLIKNNIIKYKKLDIFYAIPLEEMERVENFLENNIEFQQLYRILNKSNYNAVSVLFKNKPFMADTFNLQKQFGRLYVNKEMAIEYKNYLQKHFTFSEIKEQLKIDNYKFQSLKRKLNIKPKNDYDKITRYSSSDINIMRITLAKEYNRIKSILRDYISYKTAIKHINYNIIDCYIKNKYFKIEKIHLQYFISRIDYNNLYNQLQELTFINDLAKKYNKSSKELRKICTELKINLITLKFRPTKYYLNNTDMEFLENYLTKSKI